MVCKDDCHQIMVMIRIFILLNFMQKTIEQTTVCVGVRPLMRIRQPMEMFMLIKGMCDRVMDIVGEVDKTAAENTGGINRYGPSTARF